MKREIFQLINDQDINVTEATGFKDADGISHPRNILWNWSESELWERLHIYFMDVPEPHDLIDEQKIMTPKPPEPPEPVLPPPPPPPPEPAPPAPPPIQREASNLLMDTGIALTPELEHRLKQATHSDAKISTMMAYGGIAIRTLTLHHAGQYHQGHRHNYDHVTNLVQGSVICEVDGCEPKLYVAPCQITIGADHWHKFTAVSDDVLYQCIYRQPDREDLYSFEHSPYGEAPFTPEELVAKLKVSANPCAHCDCEAADES